MMATDVDGGASGVAAFQVDEAYEFCAPMFFDFLNQETKEEVRKAELWFETALSYAPSPFMRKIKLERSFQIDRLCDFGNEEKESQEVEEKNAKNSFDFIPENKASDDGSVAQDGASMLVDIGNDPSSFAFPVVPPTDSTVVQAAVEACTPKVEKLSVKALAAYFSQKAKETRTPKAQGVSSKGVAPTSSKTQTAKKIVSQTRQHLALNLKNQSPTLPSMKSTKPKTTNRCPGSVSAKKSMAADIAQEYQAIKRQKLEGGESRKILNMKSRAVPHKSKLGLTSGGVDIFTSAAKGHQEARHNSLIAKETTPFISAAEMVNKFQSKTRDIDLSRNGSLSHVDIASVIQRRTKLTLTRPKEPELETSHRVRAVRVKSSAELEEEMLSKIPKFKARPVNKKILQAPTLPALPRSAPHPPEFQEFHLKTMERANQHAETSSIVSSTIDSSQNQSKPIKLTEPKPPLLETSLRARPSRIKSTVELELEELQKAPKFKARLINKKIFESKGDIGLFHNPKRQVTTPREFHFATDERIGPPAAAVMELFDKLSLHSESSHRDQQEVPRLTIPNPFHLHTEERGLEKERQFSVQILQKQQEEERARIPKANPYPYTTDYPVIPPKPEPKKCTKPEGFQLERLVRHEEELQRKQEEKERMEKEDAQRRLFKAQPIMEEDPLPLPEKARKPLTEVQEFVLHVDHRAVHRSEFDKKVKEKEQMYKRQREESETAKQIEEEKALKQLRRTMVPHARSLPKFDNPFIPRKSAKETTKAKSPNLRVVHREERRRAHHLR